MRVELFGDEIESLRWFSTFTQRSLAEAEAVEIAPAAELDPEYRELARAGRIRGARRAAGRRRGPAGRALPLVPRADPGATAAVVLAAEEELRAGARRPLAGRHDQPPLRRRAPASTCRPRASREALDERVAVRLSAVSGDQPHSFRAQAADTAARTVREAEPELEKLVRSGYVTVVAWARRGEAERAAYNLARLRPALRRTATPKPSEGAGLWFASAAAARGLHRAAAEARRDPRPPAAAPPARRAARAAPRRAIQAFTDLRAGDIVVHTDHGIGRFTGFDTKTVGGVTRDYLRARVPRRGPRLRPHRPARRS